MSKINKEELRNKEIHFYGEKISIPNKLWIHFNKWLKTSQFKAHEYIEK
ncbi:hypothetical protein KGF41_14140 [Clostridioides sp. ZZV14-6150]|nr:hypothetical protein [Clostridioides sp. ZZV14-6150]